MVVRDAGEWQLRKDLLCFKKNPDKNVDLRKTGNVVNAESLPQFSGFD